MVNSQVVKLLCGWNAELILDDLSPTYYEIVHGWEQHAYAVCSPCCTQAHGHSVRLLQGQVPALSAQRMGVLRLPLLRDAMQRVIPAPTGTTLGVACLLMDSWPSAWPTASKPQSGEMPRESTGPGYLEAWVTLKVSKSYTCVHRASLALGVKARPTSS